MLLTLKNTIKHLSVVLLFAITPYLFSPDFGMGWQIFSIPPFVSSFVGNLLLCLVFYLNVYWLFPEYYASQNQLKFYAINGIIMLITFSVLSSFFTFITPPPLPEADFHPRPRPFIDFGYLIKFALVVAVVVLYKSSQMLKEIQLEKSKSELNFLKAQINPHFLFNTMNTIYALTLKKSDHAPFAVQKLSDIMRYMFTDGNQEKVSIAKEISYLKDYVALQQMRLNPEKTQVSFEEKIAESDMLIAPMLLYPFVENAFKYGVNPEEYSQIAIAVKCNNSGKFSFVVSNTVVAVSGIATNAIGLTNTEKRLRLLYPDKHKLSITQQNNCYIVVLELDLV